MHIYLQGEIDEISGVRCLYQLEKCPDAELDNLKTNFSAKYLYVNRVNCVLH